MHRFNLSFAAFCLSASLAAAGDFTYTLEKDPNPTDDQLDAYARIEKAMDTAVRFYDNYTSIRHHVIVRYDPGVPTADDVKGGIRFGSGREYMVALTGMHGISHSLGVGSSAQYAAAVSNGYFNGPLATAALRQIEHNDTLRLHADGLHIWPYGLNYASEVESPSQLVNHCRIIEALYKDLFHESTYLEGRIRNVSTKKCISLSDGTVAMGSCADSASLVRIVAMGDSNPFYRLELGTQVLDAPNQSAEAGIAMGIWTWNGGKNQQFTLESSPNSGGRASRLKMAHNGLYLHPAGSWLIQDAIDAGAGFDWELIKGSTASIESTYLEGRIRNVSSRQCISLIDSALAMGSCLDTASFVRIVAVGNAEPVYRLELAFKVLDAPNRSTQAGLTMGVWTWNGGKNQEFALEKSMLSDGPANRLKMLHSGLYLHPSGTSLAQDLTTAGSDFDWELIQGSVSVPTRLIVPARTAVPVGDRPRVDALGRRSGRHPFSIKILRRSL